MPKTTKSGKAKPEELPSTLQRSEKHAQQTFAKAHDAAAEQYGDPARAHQVAFAAVKHSYEKVGDHWERKEAASADLPTLEPRRADRTPLPTQPAGWTPTPPSST